METVSKTIEASLSRAEKRAGSVSARRVGLYFFVIAILLILVFIAGVAIGSTPISTETVARVLGARILPRGWIDLSNISEPEQVVVWLIRTPRVLVAVLVGASLGVAGAQMQGLF